ncbi:MAG: GNAT family N-acetyltransferase [Patescibacteria group bacterium]
MLKIIRADERHRADINRLIKEAKIGSGLDQNEPIKNFWVVRKNNRIVACAGLDSHNNASILTTLAVEREYRHQGIGASLIGHRLRVARQRGSKIVALITMYYHFNFYKRRGFKTCPRKNLPESIIDYSQFTSQRYKKCAVMFQTI